MEGKVIFKNNWNAVELIGSGNSNKRQVSRGGDNVWAPATGYLGGCTDIVSSQIFVFKSLCI